MTDNLQHINVDDEAYEGAPKALRDYVKKLQAQNQTLNTDLGQVRGQLASKAVGDVLAGQGFKNPKVVEKALLGDGIDPLDKSAVDAWLAQNSDDYAKGPAAPTNTPVTNERADAQAQIDQAVQAAQGGAVPGAWERAQSEISALGANPLPEAIEAIFTKHGV